MKSVGIVFYMDIHDLKERRFKDNVESVVLLIDYIRIITRIHCGQFDMSHMDGYGPNGLDRISIDFKDFESFREFMEEKWISKIDALSIPERDLILHYKKQEGSD